MIYTLKTSYYSCHCGGTFYVDLRAQSYGIYPCIYNYICDKCGARKSMTCKEEVESLVKIQNKVELTHR